MAKQTYLENTSQLNQVLNFFLNKFIYLCMYVFVFGCVGSLLLHVDFIQLRQVGATLRCGARASHCSGFLLQSTGSRHTASAVVALRLSSCGTRAQQLWLAGSRAQAQQLWHTGLAAPWHVGSSRTRARTRVPCIDRLGAEFFDLLLLQTFFFF